MLQEEILSIALAAEAEGFASVVWERLAGLLMRRWSKLSKRLEHVGTSRKFNVSQITKVGVHSAHLIFFHFFHEKCARALLESMLVLPELLLQAPGETNTSHASHDLLRIQ